MVGERQIEYIYEESYYCHFLYYFDNLLVEDKSKGMLLFLYHAFHSHFSLFLHRADALLNSLDKSKFDKVTKTI